MKLFFFVVFILFGIGSGVSAKTIIVEATDGFQLSAKYHAVNNSKASVLLFHQCNRDQRMWKPLVEKLIENNMDAFTADFRGYNESKNVDFNTDTDENYLKSNNHIKSDSRHIFNKWIELTQHAKNRIIIGASCGGGQATALAANNNDIDALILFSPSLREYWFDNENWAKIYQRKNLPVLGIASVGDKNALGAVEKITNNSTASYTELKRYNGKLHGEPLFKHDPILADKMVVWIKQLLAL